MPRTVNVAAHRAASLAARLALLASVLLVAGCPAKTRYYDYSKEPDPRRNSEYVIGVADTLQITVWKNADLSTGATVRPDGTITLPLVGDLRAAGRTPSQLRAEITKRLASFVKDESAVVTVAVTGVNSYRFFVSGNVEHPGVFGSNYYVTVAEAIALAGGLNKFASSSGVLVIRTDARGSRRIPINYADVRSGRRPEANLVVLAGDTVYVP